MDDHTTRPDKKIGEYTSNLRTLLDLSGREVEVKSEGKSVGFILFSNLSVACQPSFLDYLRSGLQLNLITAIDFTGSNGNPSSPTSLHYPGRYGSQYEMCIHAVGSIVCPYDADQQFLVYGFGGSWQGQTDHCLQLPPGENRYVTGLQGIIETYRSSLAQVSLSGPTYFSQVIDRAVRVSHDAYARDQKTYTILMILTDGACHDVQETIDLIVQACYEPMSIIIVGIGNDDFSDMERLDGDERCLRSSRGVWATRDIVQFVPFARYVDNPGRLASEVLAEIPKQVDQWAKTSGFASRVVISDSQ